MQASPVAQKSFLWKVPGKRIAVDLRLPVIDRITGEALDGMQADGRGIEAGGLLLGRVRRESGLTVVDVEDAEPIYCEHAAGPSLMLSASDRHSLEAQLKRRKGSVVGFYRTNTRREFAMTMEDVALMSWYFSRAADVFLLAHATREAPLRAAFVTWEGRSLGPKTPADEFPFSSAALERQSHGLPAPPSPPVVPPRRKASNGGPWIAAGVIAAGLVVGVTFESLRRSGGSAEVAVRKERVAPPAPVVPAPAPEVAAATPAPEPAPAEQAPAQAPVAAEPRPAVAEPPISRPTQPRVADRPAPPAALPTPPPSSSIRSADRQRQAFVPPRAPRPSSAETRALPELPRVALPAASRLVPLASSAAATAPASLPAATAVSRPPSSDSGESPVSVAVDAMSRVRAAKFVPPTVIRQERPHVPAELRRRLTRDVLINVRVYVNPAGKVDFAELLSDGTGENRELAALAVFASRRWQFAPANREGKPVAAQAVLRFRFSPDAR